MKTILIPTDYSPTARNAAHYALKIAKQLGVTKIILYNAYQAPPVISEPAMPAIPYIDIDTLKDISTDGMKVFKQSLEAECPEGCVIEERVEFAILSDEVKDVCKSTGADLIVMGITGTSKIEEALIGSTALSVMKHTTVPVIIVPHDNKYRRITNAMLATDLKNVAETTPIDKIKAVLKSANAALHVVNVYEEEADISGDKTYQQELLQSLLKDFQPQFHAIHNNSFVDGINDFVQTHNIDLIIAVPKKHGFFDRLFKQRHTKQLAFHTHVPLLYIHNEEL